MKKFAISLWSAEVLAIIAMLLLAVINIESILVTGPILAIIGLLFGLVTRTIGSLTTFAFALSAPLITALIALMIAVFRLGPSEARPPTIGLLVVYAVVIAPAAIQSYIALLHWRPSRIVLRNSRLQFSIRTMLLVMTATGLALAGGKALIDYTGFREPAIFGIYSLVNVVLCALVAALFVGGRSRPSMPETPEMRDSNHRLTP